MTPPMRWCIYFAGLDPVKSSEQGGQRPVIVVSNEDFNQLMSIITVLPLTSLKPGRRIYPGELLIQKGGENLDVDSLILAHQIRTISKKRLGKLIGILNNEEARKGIEAAIKMHLDLE